MHSTIPILDLLYPRHCAFCEKLLAISEGHLCAHCKSTVHPIDEPYCMKCGKAIDRDDEEYCQDCIRIEKHFVRGFPLYEYKPPVQDAVLAMKYYNKREYAEGYANELLQHYEGSWRRIGFDAIIPVPVHPKKKRKRGYNQAELLAKPISISLGVPLVTNYLKRGVDTRPQKELNDIERMKNLKKAFFLGENSVKLNKVLLVDDIYTSGATIESCTNVLMTGGTKEVYYTSVCIGRGY